MKKTAKTWQKQLRLEETPDAELLALLEQARDDKPKGKSKKTSKYRFVKTSEAISQTFEKAVLQESLGALLSKARKETGLTMQAVGEKIGVSRGRIAQIESMPNLELQTLVRQADVLGYDVVVTLQPRSKKKAILQSNL